MGKVRGVLTVFCIFILLLASLSRAAEVSNLAQRPTRPSCARLLKVAAFTLVSGLIGISTPSLYYEVNAAYQGEKHIGLGIYFNMEKIKRQLNSRELELLKDPQKNAVRIGQMFNYKLFGDYDREVANRKGYLQQDYFPPIQEASRFFRGNPGPRGICRHKALILKAILSELKIRAELRMVENTDGQGGEHVIVYISEYDLVLDPTNSVTESMKNYRDLISSWWPKSWINEEPYEISFFTKGLLY